MSEENSEVSISEQQLEALARQKFQERLAEHERATQQKMIEAMRQNGADPAYIYAFEKTGLLVFQETMDQFTEEQLGQWADAYEEYQG